MSLPKEAVEDDAADRKTKDLSDSEVGLDKLEKEEELSEDEKEGHSEKHKEVICECVNGDCKPGKAECNSCIKGFHGTLCDIPSGGKVDYKTVDDDDEFGLHDNDEDSHSHII